MGSEEPCRENGDAGAGDSAGLIRLRRRGAIAQGVLAFLILAVAFGAVAHYYLQSPLWPKNFGLFDDRYFYGPNAYFLDTSLNNGEFPLWNPLVYAGMPFAADPQTSMFYPPHLLRSLLTPADSPRATATSLQILLALHVLLGGFGAYVLAREYRLSFWAALTGALIFMLGPFSVVYYTEFYIFPLVTAWAPWLLWLTRRALWARDFYRFALYTMWAALCFGMSTLVLFPQLSLYMGLMLFFFVALNGLVQLRRPRRGSFRRVLVALARGIVLLTTVAVAGALIGAVVLLPAYEFGQYSVRTAVAGLIISPWRQNLEWSHLLKCLIVFPGNTWLPQGCRAAGIGSLLAVVAAFSHRDRRDMLVFLGMFLLMTDLTLGPPFPIGKLLHSVDFLNITFSPWRAGIFSSLCLAMVVAFGVDAAARTARGKWRGVLRTGVLVVAGIWMLGVLAGWLIFDPLFEPTSLVWLLPAMSLVAFSVFTWTKQPETARAVVAVLIGLEIIAWSGQMLPTYVGARIGGQSTATFGEAHELWQGNYRRAVARPNWNMWTLEGAVNGYGPIYVGQTRQLLCGPAQEKRYLGQLRKAEVEEQNLRGTLFAKRSFWLARQWVTGPLPGKDVVFPAASTVYLPEIEKGAHLGVPEIARGLVENRGDAGRVERIDVGSGGALEKIVRKEVNDTTTLTLPKFVTGFTHSVLYVGYRASETVEIGATSIDENGDAFPLYRHSAPKTYGREKLLAFPLPDCGVSSVTLAWPSRVKDRVAITQAYVLKDLDDENARINILHRGANSVAVEVTDIPGPRILTFVDSAYPGWRAEIDGKAVPILRANDGFKAVPVPAGTHQIRFVYHSRTTQIGLLISVASLLLVIAALVWLSRRYRARSALDGIAAKMG